jgi:TPR repeat protein
VGKGRYSERFLFAIDHALQFKEKDRPQTINAWKAEFDLPEDPIKKADAVERKTTQPGTKVLEKQQQKSWLFGRVVLLGVIFSVAITYFYRNEIQGYFWLKLVPVDYDPFSAAPALPEGFKLDNIAPVAKKDAATSTKNPFDQFDPSTAVPVDAANNSDNDPKEHLESERQRVMNKQYEDGVAADKSGNYQKALSLYIPPAEQGHALAQFRLGGMYFDGHGVQKNTERAFSWFQKSAEQGNAAAQLMLGAMYNNGGGVPLDHKQAAHWFQKAAEQGVASAQGELGLMYARGEGVPLDPKQAVHWYQKASEQGDAEAQLRLGFMYSKGEGIPKDDKQAVHWFQKSAEQGNVWAQYNLGLMYDTGQGVPENSEQAVYWIQKSAEQGNAEAQLRLGLKYAIGKGLPKDFEKGLHWIQKSADQGNEGAIKFLSEYKQ